VNENVDVIGVISFAIGRPPLFFFYDISLRSDIF
jgi:hypothetical protein